MDVVKLGMKNHQLGEEDFVEPKEEFELPTPEDFGLKSFDDYVPHEDDDEFEEESSVEEIEEEKLKLNWSLLMKSQERIFLRFDEQIKFDTALSLLLDFTFSTSVYRKGKVTVFFKIEEGDLVPLPLHSKQASIAFAKEELKAIHENPETTFDFFPIVQLENGARYAVQHYPGMVAQLSPDGFYKNPYQLSAYPVVESGELKSSYSLEPYQLAELKS